MNYDSDLEEIEKLKKRDDSDDSSIGKNIPEEKETKQEIQKEKEQPLQNQEIEKTNLIASNHQQSEKINLTEAENAGSKEAVISSNYEFKDKGIKADNSFKNNNDFYKKREDQNPIGFGSGGNAGFKFGSSENQTGFGGPSKIPFGKEHSGGFRGDYANMPQGGGFGSSDRFGRGGFGGGRRFNDRDRGDRNFGNRNTNRFGANQNYNREKNMYSDDRPNNHQNEIKRESDFYMKHREIINVILETFPNIPPNTVESCLRYAIQNRITIFELINLLKFESSCGEMTKASSFVTSSNETDSHLAYRFSIFEMQEDYVNPNHRLMIERYKVKSLSGDDSMGFKSPEDRRRVVFKDGTEKYNYYPLMCKTHRETKEEINADKDSEEDNEVKIDVTTSKPDSCKYAHTVNEINFHPLVYKTKICRNNNCRDPNQCCNSHDIQADFRRIYPIHDEMIIKLTISIEKHPFAKHLKNYNEYLQYPTSFSLESYKVMECQNYPFKCQLDRHLCYNYHIISERRRPPILFRYSDEICRNILNPHDPSSLVTALCWKGDHCDKSHGIYERNYHGKCYGRMNRCLKSKDQFGRCIFYETCSGFHSVSEDKESQLEERLQKFRCMNCNTLPQEALYILLKCCSRVICRQCTENMIKSETDENDRKCILCGKILEKKSLLKVNFEKSFDPVC